MAEATTPDLVPWNGMLRERGLFEGVTVAIDDP